jgi:hypothetical protein
MTPVTSRADDLRHPAARPHPSGALGAGSSEQLVMDGCGYSLSGQADIIVAADCPGLIKGSQPVSEADPRSAAERLDRWPRSSSVSAGAFARSAHLCHGDRERLRVRLPGSGRVQARLDRRDAARPGHSSHGALGELIVALETGGPIRPYLEAVRHSAGQAGLSDPEAAVHRRGIVPDGELSLDLARLTAAGLVEEFKVEIEGLRHPVLRWRITPAGSAKLEQLASGGPESLVPYRATIGAWHRVDDAF